MKVFKFLIIGFCLLMLLGISTFFTKPTLFITFTNHLKWPETVVLSAPQYCMSLMPWLNSTTTDIQSLTWPHLQRLAELESSDLQKKIENPGLFDQFLRLTMGYNSTNAAQNSVACLQQLMGEIQSESKNMIALFKMKKLTSIEWQKTLIRACHEQLNCTKIIIDEMRHEKEPKRRQSWLSLLAELGQIVPNTALEQLKSFPDLNFTIEDTPSESELLSEILVTSLLTKSNQLLDIVRDEKLSLSLRARIAGWWIRVEGPREELWPLVQQLLLSPMTNAAYREQILLHFAPLWSSHPELIIELTKQLNRYALEPPSTHSLNLLNAFATSFQREPAYAEPLAEDTQKSLVVAMAELINAFQVNSEHLNELLSTLHNHPLFADKSLLATQLFLLPNTADLGMDLLLGGQELNATVVAQLRKSFDNLPADLRTNLSHKAKDIDLIAVLLPALPPARAQQIWKKNQPKALSDALRRWSQQIEINPALRAGYEASSLSHLPQLTQVKSFTTEFMQNFKCEAEWIQTAQNIVQSGYTQPGFSPAVLSLLSCPENTIDDKLLGQHLLNAKAQKQIKKDLAGDIVASPVQLKRLTHLLSLANRIPGASLPAKIKQSGS